MVTSLERIPDTQDDQENWVIEGMLPAGHKGLIAACEGACKTTLLAWIAVCVATGNKLFGMDVRQGSVLMIDEETPEQSLYKKLHRFCLHFDLEGRHKLSELRLMSRVGFRFARKNTEIIDIIGEMQPTLITIDTLLACLPSGRQGKEENNANTGIAIRDNLNEILSISPDTSILMTAHSGKPVMNFSLEDYKKAEMQALVRGHGSIVGEACDTGYGLKKISEHPSPLRFVLIPKPRREAIPIGDIYVEMKEQQYGKGRARLERIEPVVIPPSRAEIDIFSLFIKNSKGKDKVSAQTIRNSASALYVPLEIRLALNQLMRNRLIVTTKDNFTFKLNPREREEADSQYVEKLLEKLSAS